MMRRIFPLAVVGLLLVAGCEAGAIRFSALAAAQEDAPDLGVGLPDGIDLETLASGIATSLPAAPADLRLERVTVEAGGDTGLRSASGPELLYVETGTLLIADEIGIEGAYPEHAQLLVPMGASYGIRNDGGDDAVLLRIGLASSETGSQPDANAGSGGGESETLLQSTLTSLPSAPVRVFVARATWEAGADLGQQAFTGPIGMFGEQGTLTIAGPSGIEGQLPEGKGVVFPGGAPSKQRNAGADTVVTLVVGIIPAGGGLIATTMSEAGETASPTADQALPPGVLYDSEIAGGLDEWSLSGGWRHFRGMLVNDGGGGTISAPYEPTVPSYAIEAEIQVVSPENNSQAYGFSLGKDYARVSIAPYGTEVTAFLFIGEEIAARVDFENEIGLDWQRYRLEVDGNRVVLSIDGSPVLDAIDNRLLSTSGAPGLFTVDELQVNVRSFRIVELTGSSAEAATDRVQTVAPGSLSGSASGMDVTAVFTMLAEPPPIRFLATSPPREATVPHDMELRRYGTYEGTEVASSIPAHVHVRARGIG